MTEPAADNVAPIGGRQIPGRNTPAATMSTAKRAAAVAFLDEFSDVLASRKTLSAQIATARATAKESGWDVRQLERAHRDHERDEAQRAASDEDYQFAREVLGSRMAQVELPFAAAADAGDPPAEA